MRETREKREKRQVCVCAGASSEAEACCAHACLRRTVYYTYAYIYEVGLVGVAARRQLDLRSGAAKCIYLNFNFHSISICKQNNLAAAEFRVYWHETCVFADRRFIISKPACKSKAVQVPSLNS